MFDLSADAPRAERAEAMHGIVGRYGALRRALAEHLQRAELVVISGNHDADMIGADGPLLAGALGLDAAERRRLHTSPWFWRDGGLHVEHGHLYDPDNAPEHPLVVGEPSLGVHFSEAFLKPTGAYRYLSNNDGTPLSMFLSSFRWYGVRAPYVIYRYFHAALSALGRSGPFYRARHETALGVARQADFAADLGLSESVIEAVLAARAPSTLESWARTFARLYLDRVSATLLCGAAAHAAWRRRPFDAAVLGTLGAMLMTLSWARGHDRYGGSVVQHLERAARRIADEAGADFVVFGHTHREALDDRYANTGSFAFPRGAPGRPYLRLSRDGRLRAERAYFKDAAPA